MPTNSHCIHQNLHKLHVPILLQLNVKHVFNLNTRHLNGYYFNKTNIELKYVSLLNEELLENGFINVT